MEPNQIDLSELKDIHPMIQPDFWPLAEGWYILCALLILIILIGFYIYHKYRNSPVVYAIKELEKIVNNTSTMQEKLAHYERIEGTLNRAIMMAQKTSDQIKFNAHRESEIILNDAKTNASRIVNESLLKAEKTEMEAEALKRNIKIFKRKLRGIIEAQLEMVDDIEKVEL